MMSENQVESSNKITAVYLSCGCLRQSLEQDEKTLDRPELPELQELAIWTWVSVKK